MTPRNQTMIKSIVQHGPEFDLKNKNLTFVEFQKRLRRELEVKFENHTLSCLSDL